MKNKIKIIIDILMFIIIILLMGYHITNNFMHEILGTTEFILFIVHNLFNIKWYGTIFKGKHDAKRNFHIIINLLLLVSFVLTILSGILMSKSLYTFLNFKMAAISRRVHLIANAWTLVLISIHLGLHLEPVMIRIKNKLGSRIFNTMRCIIIVSGLIFFISIGVWRDMFGITLFKMFNFSENPAMFYLKYFTMAFAIALVTNVLINKNMKKES